MRLVKQAILLLLVLVSTGFGYGLYLYNKQPVNVREQNAQMEIPAAELLRSFQHDEALATRNYVNKVIIVSGQVSGIQYNPTGSPTVFLSAGDPVAGVTCSFYESESNTVTQIKTGTFIRVKGNCTGILMDVVLNKCTMAR